jgi:hypothetical protein
MYSSMVLRTWLAVAALAPASFRLWRQAAVFELAVQAA